VSNHTLNETLTNATASITSSTDLGTAIQLLFTVLLPEFFYRYFLFFATPFTHTEMWWLLIHLILTFVLFEFYFERHEDEDLGWTAALANSIVMFFISMELLRVIYGHKDSPFTVLINIFSDYAGIGFFSQQMMLVSLIIILGLAGIATAVINYYHLLPRKLAFIISGHKTVNLLAYFLMVVTFRTAHGYEVPLDGITFAALLLFGITMWIIMTALTNYKRKKRASKSTFRLFK
jgi:hypothetical protein